MRVFRAVLGLPLVAALTWSGMHAPRDAAPRESDSAPATSVIYSTDATSALPFIGGRGSAFESGATVVLHALRSLPRGIRAAERELTERSQQARHRSRVRTRSLEVLDYSHALVRVRSGAVSSLATSTPPPSA